MSVVGAWMEDIVMCTIAVDDELQGAAVLQIMAEDIAKFTMHTDQVNYWCLGIL